MKKCILNISIGLLCSINAYTQIGIMTSTPASNTLLHIDAQGNNKNAIVIDKNGNVGIGTTNPQTKLHIVTGGTASNPKPQFIIEDGYQAMNKVLMSDDNGLAKWSDYIPGYINGDIGSGITYATTSNIWAPTNMNILVDPGHWLIFYTISMLSNEVLGQDPNYRFWIQISLGDATTSETTDAISKNRFSNNGFINKRSSINGWVAVDNKTSSPKTYILYIGEIQRSLAGLELIQVGEKNDGYSSIYAFRVNMQ